MRAIRTGRGSWIPSELRWLFREIRPFLRWHIASFICISVGSSLGLLTPLVLKWLIDSILPGRETIPLFRAVVLIFLCHEGKAVLSTVSNYLTLLGVQRLALDLRIKLLRHIDTLSADYHERTSVGVSLYPMKDPIDDISYFGSDLVPAILRTLLAIALTIAMMLFLNVKMTLAVLPVIPVFLLARKYLRMRFEIDSDLVQKNQQRWNGFLQEHISSIVTIQLLRKERQQERKAFSLLGQRVRSVDKLLRTGILFTFYTSLTVALTLSMAIGFGGWSVLTNTLTLGGLVAFYTYLTQLFEPLSGAAELYVRAQKAFSSIRCVQATLATVPSIRDRHDAIKLGGSHSSNIEMRDVSFAYAGGRGRLSIDELSIRTGERLAIVGGNGAGKSTLAKLIARLYDVDSGFVTIGGLDVRDIEISSLREQVCYVPAHSVLFDTTVERNVRLGRPNAPAGEVAEAIEAVGLTDWVGTLPKGLAQQIGPAGSLLSGGQRQRIAIARSILQRPQVLILDEASSAFDAASEQDLLHQLGNTLPGTTIIIISHRLSALSCVKRIVLLEAGRVMTDASPTVLFASESSCSRLFHASILA
jgi:ABC-type multidrug transport system fused ATPase/permease subunit